MSGRCPNQKCGYKIGDGIAANCAVCIAHNKDKGRKRIRKAPKVKLHASASDNVDEDFEHDKKLRSSKAVTLQLTRQASALNQQVDLYAINFFDNPKLCTVVIEDIPLELLHRVTEDNLCMLFRDSGTVRGFYVTDMKTSAVVELSSPAEAVAAVRKYSALPASFEQEADNPMKIAMSPMSIQEWKDWDKLTQAANAVWRLRKSLAHRC